PIPTCAASWSTWSMSTPGTSDTSTCSARRPTAWSARPRPRPRTRNGHRPPLWDQVAELADVLPHPGGDAVSRIRSHVSAVVVGSQQLVVGERVVAVVVLGDDPCVPRRGEVHQQQQPPPRAGGQECR